jgi:hypothetical protein
VRFRKRAGGAAFLHEGLLFLFRAGFLEGLLALPEDHGQHRQSAHRVEVLQQALFPYAEAL